MTKLLWDQMGERLFETGLDHGVLYLPNDAGVAWNGLVSVEEDLGDDTSTASYIDGIKYLDYPSFGDFAATLTAYTYPDEFLAFEGVTALSDGLYVDGQTSNRFGLSYRTLIGNDVAGDAFGYKIHLIYNLTATPQPVDYETLNDSPNPVEFTWSITAVPTKVPGFRPTAHLIFDSRYLDPTILAALETILYGDDVVTVVIDGGTPLSNRPDILDGGLLDVTNGGTPGSTWSNYFDGGTPGATYSDILDGGLVVDVVDIVDGGIPAINDIDPSLPHISDLMSLITP
jgi:hypothetical protein